MAITLNISKLYKAYELLSVCKFTKLSDDDKLRMWRILKAFKPVYEKFNDEIKIAVEKFRPYDDYEQRLETGKKYEILRDKGEIENLPMTEDEYNVFLSDYQRYNDLVDKAISEYGETEVSFDIDCLSEEAYGSLMASNDWSAEQVIFLGDVLTEQENYKETISDQ